MRSMKVIAKNRRARYDYEISDTIEAGIILTGQEVKSCRLGHMNLSGSYVSFREGKPILKNASIAPYPYAGKLPDYVPTKDRMLLLSAAELQKIEAASSEKGMTVLPMEVRAGRFIKVLLGVARGRKKHDKRERIRERDVERKLKRGEEY